MEKIIYDWRARACKSLNRVMRDKKKKYATAGVSKCWNRVGWTDKISDRRTYKKSFEAEEKQAKAFRRT